MMLLGIVDSLDIDWASLCSMSKQKAAPTVTSALKRYTGASVLARIGLSRAYAGDVLFKKIQAKCRAQQEEDAGKRNILLWKLWLQRLPF